MTKVRGTGLTPLHIACNNVKWGDDAVAPTDTDLAVDDYADQEAKP